MPVEIELLNINASSLERVLEANLTNLFGTSSDDFLSFKQEKNSETYSKKTMHRRMINKSTWIYSTLINGFCQIRNDINKMLIELLSNI